MVCPHHTEFPRTSTCLLGLNPWHLAYSVSYVARSSQEMLQNKLILSAESIITCERTKPTMYQALEVLSFCSIWKSYEVDMVLLIICRWENWETHEVKVRKQLRDRTRIQAQFCEAPESQDTFNHLTLKLFYDFYTSFFLSGFLKFLIKVLVKSQRLIIHFKSFHNVPWQEKNSLSIDIVRGPLVCHLRLSPKQGDYLRRAGLGKKKWNIY